MKIFGYDLSLRGIFKPISSLLSGNQEPFVIYGSVGNIEIITQRAIPKQPLPQDVIEKAISNSYKQDKVLVLHLRKNKIQSGEINDQIIVGTVTNYTKGNNMLKVDFDFEDEISDYVREFITSEKQVREGAPTPGDISNLEAEYRDQLISTIPLKSNTITLGEGGTYSVLGIEIFPEEESN